jgi:hypothetical protein
MFWTPTLQVAALPGVRKLAHWHVKSGPVLGVRMRYFHSAQVSKHESALGVWKGAGELAPGTPPVVQPVKSRELATGPR